MNEGVENQLRWRTGARSATAAAQGARWTSAAGYDGLALRQLRRGAEQTKRDLHEITGIADIVRGQGMASATATAERLKGQFAQLRRSRRRGGAVLPGHGADYGEIIAKHPAANAAVAERFSADDRRRSAGCHEGNRLLKNDQTRVSDRIRWIVP